jgi:TatA/E family protein of Tat protein translocase
MILILAIALIVIGPKKLPDLAKSLGRAMREFKKATNEFKETMHIDSEMADVKKAFYDIKDDVKTAVDPKPEQGDKSDDLTKPDGEKDAGLKKDASESDAAEFKNLNNLKNAFDDLNSKPAPSEPEESAPVDEPPANDESKNINPKGPVDNA